MFRRVIEDFDCVQCGHAVSGNGYTNHCPKCLWSVHVDEDPGDRAADCGKPMKPVHAFLKGERIRITHECTACGLRKNVNSVRADDYDQILTLMRASAERMF
ncbi:RNHCP domain-containing protein [Pseudonocardiaceae bacterium YIM PH 21723]|nr:RNHCP domain-containing protein [Pseudonocardiaceae bacterium YIM PH 21723]